MNVLGTLILAPQVQVARKPSSPWQGGGFSVGRVPWSPVTCGAFLCPLSTIQASAMLYCCRLLSPHPDPPPTQAKVLAKGTLEGEEKVPSRRACYKVLNGPIEAPGLDDNGPVGAPRSAEVRGLGPGRQCWLRGQTLTSRAGSQRF